jgi:hypothetical protein
VNITYTRSGQTTRLQADDAKQWEIVDFVRGYFHPQETVDKREPAFLQALKLNQGKK